MSAVTRCNYYTIEKAPGKRISAPFFGTTVALAVEAVPPRSIPFLSAPPSSSRYSSVAAASLSRLTMGRCCGHACSHCPHWMHSDASVSPARRT